MNNSFEKEPAGSGLPKPAPSAPRESIMGGVILITLGLLFLARNLIPWFDFSDYWPVILIAIGVALIWRSRRSS